MTTEAPQAGKPAGSMSGDGTTGHPMEKHDMIPTLHRARKSVPDTLQISM